MLQLLKIVDDLKNNYYVKPDMTGIINNGDKRNYYMWWWCNKIEKYCHENINEDAIIFLNSGLSYFAKNISLSCFNDYLYAAYCVFDESRELYLLECG